MKLTALQFFLLAAVSFQISARKKEQKITNHPFNVANYKEVQNNKLVIGPHHHLAGLFSIFLGALNNIAWCDKHGITPVIYWSNDCLYYESNWYKGGNNLWEYYFSPVSSEKHHPGDPIRRDYFDPDKQGIDLSFDKCKSYNTQKELRYKVHALIQKYIKIRPRILQRVSSFYDQHMKGKNTIGIHVRGTDKNTEIKQVSIEEIALIANKAAESLPECQFYVATDDDALLKQITPLLKHKVITCNSTRSTTGQPIHKFGKNKSQLGEEVIIEVQLLALCQKFIHTCSNVSSAVLFFNPELDNVLLIAA